MRITSTSVTPEKSEIYDKLMDKNTKLKDFTKEEIFNELERLLNKIDSEKAEAYRNWRY